MLADIPEVKIDFFEGVYEEKCNNLMEKHICKRRVIWR